MEEEESHAKTLPCGYYWCRIVATMWRIIRGACRTLSSGVGRHTQVLQAIVIYLIHKPYSTCALLHNKIVPSKTSFPLSIQWRKASHEADPLNTSCEICNGNAGSRRQHKPIELGAIKI